MFHQRIIELAEKADMLDEMVPLVESGNLTRAQQIVREAGEELAISMGRNSDNLLYSFSMMREADAESTTAEKELYALQKLHQVLGLAIERTATQT